MSLVVKETGVGDGTTRIDYAQTLKAAKALVAHIKKAAKERAATAPKRNLLDDPDDENSGDVGETPIWLTLTTKRHIHENDRARLRPSKVRLPHPLNSLDTSSICLITADPQRAYKDIVASDAFPAALRARIGRVIGYTKIRSKYRQYESQRQLRAEHDVFLGDERIINRLPQALGKTFYKSTTKRPIPVVLAAKTRGPKADKGKQKQAKAKAAEDKTDPNAASATAIAAEIEKAVGAALVSMSASTNTMVKIGYAGWPAEHIAANAEVVAAALADKFVPQGWKNVRSIYIKGPETTALPIWLTEELWMDRGDVVPMSAESQSEKPNVGKKRLAIEEEEGGKGKEKETATGGKKSKKRKSLGEEAELEKDKTAPPPSKKTRKTRESDDTQLLKQISDTKDRLRKQKKKAKSALDD